MNRIILFLVALSCVGASPPNDWKLKLQTSNTAELQLLGGLESDLASARAASQSAQSETLAVQKAADALKAERDRNAAIATKAIARQQEAEKDEAEQRALAWKWRCFAIGTWVLIAGLIAAKIYLKAWLPFL